MPPVEVPIKFIRFDWWAGGVQVWDEHTANEIEIVTWLELSVVCRIPQVKLLFFLGNSSHNVFEDHKGTEAADSAAIKREEA